MNKLSIFIAVISLQVLASCESNETAPENASELAAQIGALVDQRTGNVPFEAPVAWAMIENGQTKASFIQGAEEPGGATKVSDRTLFILASTAKLLTSTMVMKAVEEGKLQLTAKAGEHLNGLPATWVPVTIGQLLSHADGIPDVMENERYRALPIEKREHMSRTDYLAHAAEMPLHFTPGSQSRYGQTGFVLLSVILEKVYGKSYEEIVREKILNPLEMTDTRFITHHSAIEGSKPQIFEVEGKGFRAVTPEYVYADFATAGVCSSLRDMSRFIAGLQNNRLITEPHFRQLYTPVKGLPGFALGWEYRYKDGELMAGHSGGWSVVVMHLPKSNTTSIFLSSAADESILTTGYQAAEKVKQFIDKR
ncbi:CubicO group peptidase, beta-lactamase class C family [Dyadobacter soli]|uniref:CubicO group peptidase, beta-lactamase class C family n=1 Tax=Dyadobacter soli TaxID=659014 RepID=A0A1G7Y1N3_9BACT|nr:serine hydrolase domain-containing protein [Dyadobacter soli]SDG90368.1 CubicO group peptidase, beta-lactamase class C family [Dyadobacter soli]